MNYGLSQKHLLDIQKVLGRFPAVERAVLFGSRAKGNYCKESDIDIVVEGKEVDLKEAAFIKLYIKEETPIPYSFDVVAHQTIDSKKLLDHLKKDGVVIYEKRRGPGRRLKPAMDILMDRIMGRKKRNPRARGQARVRGQVRAR